MNLKKIFPLLLLLITFSFYGQSEKMNAKKEQIKAMKVTFITNELNLTATEAEKFWPLYTVFDDKQFELRHQKMKKYLRKLDPVSLDQMPEKEANLLLSQIENTDEELFLLRKKFVANLKGFLPAVKIIKLKKSEDDFNRKLLQQYRGSKK